MFTEFYRISPDAIEGMIKLNNRVAAIAKAIGKDQIVRTSVERDGQFLYVTVQYYHKEPVSF